jgi:myo-inositol-1(or 4)-monophosphatase
VTARTETSAAIAAVERALEIATTRAGADQITLKGARDVVTATDVAVEEAIREILATTSWPVVGEEGGGSAADASSYWLVDPICGTRNFASGIPLYCANVALVEDDEVTAAVVGDASTGDVLVAERGNGAWAVANGERRTLAVSDESETIVIEDGHNGADPNRRERAASGVANVMRAFRWHVRTLSTSLPLAYVAAGRVSAYVLFSTSTLHIAAGSLLAAEAGAVVTDVDGKPWTLRSDSIVASAMPALHDDLLGLVRESAANAGDASARASGPRRKRTSRR